METRDLSRIYPCNMQLKCNAQESQQMLALGTLEALEALGMLEMLECHAQESHWMLATRNECEPDLRIMTWAGSPL